jgi:2-polyprenyl-3-methyl-5-hydroxy-6-metoxy-1,4-benzoquinol methylase
MADRATLMQTIRDAVEANRQRLGQEAIDEMAAPAYTRGNMLSRHVFWGKLNWIRAFASPARGETLFDFGCGTGILLPTWTERGASVVATDLDMTVARDVAARLGIASSVKFLESADWPNAIADGSLDVIVAANVLEHVEDCPALLRVFHRKLKPSGRLVVSGPTENSMYQLGRKIVGFSGEYHRRTIHHIIADVRKCEFGQARLKKYPMPGPGCLYEIGLFEPE